MISFSRPALLLASAAALLATAPASAITTSVGYAYDFTAAPKASSGGSDNVLTYSKKVGDRTIEVKATGWNATKSGSGYAISQGNVGRWDGGLGITSDNTDLGGEYGLHQIGNVGFTETPIRFLGQTVGYQRTAVESYDFLVLEFDTAVTLGSITRNSYGVPNDAFGSYVYDNDYSWASMPNGFPTDGSFPTINSVDVAGACGGSSGCTATSDIFTKQAATAANASRYWVVGASMTNSDGINDAFKLGGLTAYYTAPVTPPSNTPAVPEPATWAMLVLGFGIVGAAARRRRQALPAA